MKYVPVIWSGIWRKPDRTILIFLQVAVAFSLFGALQGLKSGVEHVIELMGTYQKPHQKIGLVAVRPDKHWLSAFTFVVAPATDADFGKIRTGALVKEQVARKYGWKTGDHIPLKTNVTRMNGSSDWTFDMVGTFTISVHDGAKGQTEFDSRTVLSGRQGFSPGRTRYRGIYQGIRCV
jgi:putative ABC transport system permease protein